MTIFKDSPLGPPCGGPPNFLSLFEMSHWWGHISHVSLKSEMYTVRKSPVTHLRDLSVAVFLRNSVVNFHNIGKIAGISLIIMGNTLIITGILLITAGTGRMVP